jgi:hypothetical protein
MMSSIGSVETGGHANALTQIPDGCIKENCGLETDSFHSAGQVAQRDGLVARAPRAPAESAFIRVHLRLVHVFFPSPETLGSKIQREETEETEPNVFLRWLCYLLIKFGHSIHIGGPPGFVSEPPP